MELSLSGNALKTFARSITCLVRIGNELVLQASPSQTERIFSAPVICILQCIGTGDHGSANSSLFKLILHTLNSSRSAYQSVTFKTDFFDIYSVSGAQVQYSVLLKAICSVLRTPITSIDRLSVRLTDPDASKVQWTLDCFNGMRKAYWITCNVEPDIQHLSLDRRKLPSSFVVRPRDLNRLLANFQSTLQEITIIATQPSAIPPDVADQIGGKAVELRSYIDPTKENDSLLHTQLWIDPKEEFVQYNHTGDPVDVTFGVKELKAFLSFCEGCEVDIHLYFDKAGEPILLAPKFGLDDSSFSNFDAVLVLATMLVSQLNGGNSAGPPPADTTGAPEQQGSKGNISNHLSDHTRIWSELSGSAAKDGNGAEDRQVLGDGNLHMNEQRTAHRMGEMHISRDKNATSVPGCLEDHHPVETGDAGNPQGELDINGRAFSQRHPSNWVDADEDDEEEDETDLFVQSTPPYL